MKRIMVIGCCGAGKSTISQKLKQLTGLPLFHLDQLYWKSGWVETPRVQWEPLVADLAKGDEWIIDGNYSSTMDLRIPRADTIVFLDYPTYKCFYRVVRRIMKYRGKERPDMPEGCKERFDFEFLHYVATFGFHSRKRIMRKLESDGVRKRVVLLKSDVEVEKYLMKV